MKYSEKCQYCGHQRTAYSFPLNKSLLKAFLLFADLAVRNRKRGLKKGDLGLTNSQYSNFQNLRHFGLIEQKEKGREWYLTDLGEQFYYGEASVLSPTGFFSESTSGLTIPKDHAAWQTHNEPRIYIKISDVINYEYKQRPEYQQEKATQGGLF